MIVLGVILLAIGGLPLLLWGVFSAPWSDCTPPGW